MRSIVIGFGLLIFCLLVLFRIAEVNFMQGNVKLEVIVAIAAVIFFFAGLYFNNKQTEKANAEADAGKEIPPPAVANTIDYEAIKSTGLTQREHEVLVKMTQGMSNQEIATALFLSESTIKTHVSNILFKLDAKRRTQAVQIAKDRKIVV